MCWVRTYGGSYTPVYVECAPVEVCRDGVPCVKRDIRYHDGYLFDRIFESWDCSCFRTSLSFGDSFRENLKILVVTVSSVDG